MVVGMIWDPFVTLGHKHWPQSSCKTHLEQKPPKMTLKAFQSVLLPQSGQKNLNLRLVNPLWSWGYNPPVTSLGHPKGDQLPADVPFLYWSISPSPVQVSKCPHPHLHP